MQDITNKELQENLFDKFEAHEKRDEAFQEKMQTSIDNLSDKISNFSKDIEKLKQENLAFKKKHDLFDSQHRATAFSMLVIYVIMFFIGVGAGIIYIKGS